MSNRAHRLLIAAAIHARSGNVERAGAMLDAASKDPSLPSLVARARTLASSANSRRRVSSSRRELAAWPFTQSASAAPGDELRDEPDTNGDREIQEAGIDDDLEMMGLGDDMEVASDDMDEDDFDMEVASDEGDDEESDDEDEGDDDDGDKAETAAARLTRALANRQRQAAAAKKPKAKKPARKK